jgi:hypothetical protein
VGDLVDWDLPSLDDRIDAFIDELCKRNLTVTLDRETLGEQIYAQLNSRVRKLGAAAANEAILGWLSGEADGCPELCVAFPYLGGEMEAAPLTVMYSVGAQDGSRAELHRVDLEHALIEALPVPSRSGPNPRAATMAARLRELAGKLEQSASP